MRRFFRSPLFLGLALLLGAVATLLVVDGINRPRSSPGLRFVQVDTTRHARVLILLVDSWRHETAIDARLMPEVARLSGEGASGKLETVFEGFTVPAIRAEFSGTAETQLLNLIRNFRFRALPIESSFLDASRIGKRSLVVGDEPFTQFGPFLEKRLPVAPTLDRYARDALRPGIALEAYRSGTYDLVVCHYESADWRAHELGIYAPGYAAEFRRVDSLIGVFARARRAGDYLLVFGDHGHNARGEHKTGLYIPTHGLFIGPDIEPGVVFASLPVADIRPIVDHALGIELRVPALEASRLAQFLPAGRAVAAASPDSTERPARAGPSRAAGDYLLFALFIAAFAAVFRAALSGASGTFRVTLPIAAIGALFIVEMGAQQVLHPAWSAFPFLLLVVAAAAWRVDRWSAVLFACIGVFFVTRYAPEAGAASLVRAPAGLATLVPLYAVGSMAKAAILLSIAGRGRRIPALATTAALALLEYRVWDVPALFITAIVIAAAAMLRWRSGPERRLALVAFGYAALYFTLRLPIYQYAWVDFFMVAVLVATRTVPGPWVDALIITGTFALTSLWLPSGLEWGFLYTLVPAYVVELQVAWFIPLILLKLPLLLVLTWWVTCTRPSRQFLALMLFYTGIRFAGVWIVRLLGGTGEQIWPMAEQGIYLVTFAIAAIWLRGSTWPRGRAGSPYPLDLLAARQLREPA